MRHPVNTHEPEGVRGGSGALRAQGELKLGSKNNLICAVTGTKSQPDLW